MTLMLHQGDRPPHPLQDRWARSACSAGAGWARPLLIITEMIRRVALDRGGVSVSAGVGERTREGTDLWLEMAESGVLEKAALVYGRDGRAPRGPPAAWPSRPWTVAEYFRDVQQQDVLLSIDDVFPGSRRPARRCRPSSAGCRRRWATSPRWPTRWASCRSASPRTRGRSVTSAAGGVRARRRLHRPGAVHVVRPPTSDGTTELSRDIASLGVYAAVDPLASTSTILAPEVVGQRHYAGGPPRPGDPPALQGAAGHHRHPRPRRALGGGQGHRQPGPQGPEVPVPAQCTWPRCSPASRASPRRWRRRSRASKP